MSIPQSGALNCQAREFGYSDQDFRRVCRLISEYAGIALSERKWEMVYNRLARRVRSLGIASFAKYLDALETGKLQGEREHFVNALTTNLTAFFREEHHFDILARQMADSSTRPFRIWCSASSTGEEAYSIAMTVVEHFNAYLAPVSIIASDLDTTVLRTAAHGVYPLERAHSLGSPRLKRFFLKGVGSRAGQVRVRPELQRLIDFQRINLLDETYPVEGPLDALFCRNVMIYFSKDTQRTLLKRFHAMLAPDGLLYAGHSESFLHSTDLFRPLGRTVYAPIRR